MQRLWAPWRMAYFEEKDTEQGCIFCNRATAPEEDLKRLHVLDRGRRVLIMLNKYPYNSGHIMVVPARHVSKPWDLDADEYRILSEAVRLAARALHDAVGCEGVNIGMNVGAPAGAGIAEHIHFHLVPRWGGDTNFMPVIADTRVMPEYLEATYERLEPHFRGLCIRAGDDEWIP